MTQPASDHIPALDGLRGLAILLVLFGHLILPADAQAPWFLRPFSSGFFGVELFFLLSGFLITGILCATRDSPGYFKSFYARRVLRIFPLYYLVLLGAAASVHFLSPYQAEQFRGYDSLLWYWFYASNIAVTLKGNWLNSPEWANLGHFWSLAVEEQFYLVWPLVVFLARPAAFERLCVALLILATPLTVNIGKLWGYGFTYHLTLCHIGPIVAGALLAVQRRSPERWASVTRWAPFILCASGLVLLGDILLNPPGEISTYATLWLFFGALLVMAVRAPEASLWERFFASPTLRFFGRYSYGIYIIHHLLLREWDALFAVQRFTNLGWPHAVAVLAHALCALACSIALAYLSWQLIEKRFLALKKYFIAPGRASAPSLPQNHA